MSLSSMIVKLVLIGSYLTVIELKPISAIVFDEVTSLHVWITVSSLAKRDPTEHRGLLSRQIELNWINAPLDDDNDYIGLYLDGQPSDNILPVSLHRLNGQMNGQVLTDYYLPVIDFYNEIINASSRVLGQASIMLNGVDQRESTDSVQMTVPAFQTMNLQDYLEFQTLGQSKIHSQQTLNSECIGYCLAYHSRNKILAHNCLKTKPNWMFDSFQQIGFRSLPNLMIPGTHNSGTYPKYLDKSVLQIINKYQMNQDENIFNQLVFGIRHLDLRVGYTKLKHRPERLWIYHDIFRTEVSVSQAIEQVKRFLELTSHEIVIMDFHRFTVGFQNEDMATQRDRHAKLIELIFKQLGQYVIPSYLGLHAPLNEYVAMGKRLIIGYANRDNLIGPLVDQPAMLTLSNQKLQQDENLQLQPIDYDQGGKRDSRTNKYWHGGPFSVTPDQLDRRVGARLYNRIKSLRLISNSFSKRPVKSSHSPSYMRMMASDYDDGEESSTSDDSAVSKAVLFFPPVRHLWPNKDTLAGLAQYINETTCRKYFGELSSMMVELTPTVFGAISDKYDGNRKLAQKVNRPVTDWIRNRWLHCINIVASDFFLGNDLIRLSIYANKMRYSHHRNMDLNMQGRCRSFKQVGHLLDKSKIPIQFTFHRKTFDSNSPMNNGSSANGNKYDDIITHTSSDGNQIELRPLTSSFQQEQLASRQRKDSFVENISDSFNNFVSSFKKLLNL